MAKRQAGLTLKLCGRHTIAYCKDMGEYAEGKTIKIVSRKHCTDCQEEF